ncbi:MAG: hypothetical protein ACE37D_15310, partial [Pseudomonadales bacterium]
MLRFAILSVFFAVLAGCATDPGNTPRATDTRPNRPAQQADTVFELIRAAELAAPDEANVLRLRAAELAVSLNNIQQANNIVQTLVLPMPAELGKRHALLMARLALLEGDGLSALDWLRKPAVSKTNLSQAEQVMLGEMRANAYAAARSYLAA